MLAPLVSLCPVYNSLPPLLVLSCTSFSSPLLLFCVECIVSDISSGCFGVGFNVHLDYADVLNDPNHVLALWFHNQHTLPIEMVINFFEASKLEANHFTEWVADCVCTLHGAAVLCTI
jgi:hypothetical protein